MLQIKPGVTAIIGGGGKTTLLRTLAEELSAQARVIVATSTKMRVPDWCPVLLDASLREVKAALAESPVVCVGRIRESTGKLDAPNLPFDALAALADYVLVEADGSKGLPLKAHAPHEPVIPECASNVICVVGIDGVDKPISQVCHRAERYAQLVGTSVDSLVTLQMVADVLEAEHLHQVVYINKVETDAEWGAAREIALRINAPVVAGSLWGNTFQCLR